MPHLRANVDHRSARAVGDHPPHRRLRDEEGGLEVEAEYRVVVFFGHVAHRLGPVGAGIVDEDVERGPRVEEGSDGRQVGNVEHCGLGVAAKRGSRSLDFAGASRNQRHCGAGTR